MDGTQLLYLPLFNFADRSFDDIFGRPPPLPTPCSGCPTWAPTAA